MRAARSRTRKAAHRIVDDSIVDDSIVDDSIVDDGRQLFPRDAILRNTLGE